MRNIISYTKYIKIFVLNLYLQFFDRRNSIKLRNKERRNEIIESTKLIHIKNNRICRKKSEFPILKNFNFFLN